MADLQPMGAEATLVGLAAFLRGAEQMAAAVDKYGKEAAQAADRSKKFDLSIVSIGTALGSLAAGAVTGAINLIGRGLGALTDFLGDSITAAGEASAAQAQLEAVLKSTGGAAGVTAQQANDLASAWQELTGTSDEAVLHAESVLLTFNKIGSNIFPQALEAVMNMSTALGTDLQAASIQVGKALQDPVAGITALRRAGVSFSEAQQETIKKLVETGQAAKAQQLILGELERQFGGVARAVGRELPARLAYLNERWGDFKEVVGGALGPALTAIVNAGIKQMDRLIAEATKLAQSREFIQWSARTTAAIVVVIENLGGLVTAFAGAFAAIIRIVGTAGKIIYTLLQWINPFARHSPSLVDSVEVGVDQIIASYGKIRQIQGTLDTAGDAIERLGAAARRAGKDDLAILEEAAEEAKNTIDQLNDKIRDAEDRIRDLKGTSIEGEEALSDAEFELDQQRKRAQLEVNRLKQSGGTKEQIKAAEDAVDAIDLQLENLRLQGELTFDPLRRQIDKLAEPVSELPFDEIVTGIRDAQNEIANAKEQLGPAEEAYKTLALAVDQYKQKIQELSGGGGGGGGGGGIGSIEDMIGEIPEFKSPIDAEEWAREYDAAYAEYQSTIKPMLEELNKNLGILTQDLDNAAKEAEKWSRLFSEYIIAPTTYMQTLIEKVPALNLILSMPMFNPFEALRKTLQGISDLIDLINGKRVNPPVAGTGPSNTTTPITNSTPYVRPDARGAGGGPPAAVEEESARTVQPLGASVISRPVIVQVPAAAMGAGGVTFGPNYVSDVQTAESLAYKVRRYATGPAR